jgi:integrase
MTIEQRRILEKEIKDPTVYCFFVLGWFFAARVGDLRQVEKSDFDFDNNIDTKETENDVYYCLTITFRYGKGATFWAPMPSKLSFPPSCSNC